MIVKWLQSLLRGERLSALAEDAAEEITVKEPTLMDIAHEVLSQEAQAKSSTLKGLERYGLPHMERIQFKNRVKVKVKKSLHPSLADSEDDLVEEVTEKITEAAEADPYYSRMFEKS